MGRRFGSLELDEGERRELTSLASHRSTAQGLAQRARIILACADGEQSKVVAARLGIDRDTRGKWPSPTLGRAKATCLPPAFQNSEQASAALRLALSCSPRMMSSEILSTGRNLL